MRRPPYTKWLRDCDAGWLSLEDWFPGCRAAWDEHRGVWPVVFRAERDGLVAEDMRCWGDLHRRGCECRTWDGTAWNRWITPAVPREASGDPDAARPHGDQADRHADRPEAPVGLGYRGNSRLVCPLCLEELEACRCGP